MEYCFSRFGCNKAVAVRDAIADYVMPEGCDPQVAEAMKTEAIRAIDEVIEGVSKNVKRKNNCTLTEKEIETIRAAERAFIAKQRKTIVVVAPKAMPPVEFAVFKKAQFTAMVAGKPYSLGHVSLMMLAWVKAYKASPEAMAAECVAEMAEAAAKKAEAAACSQANKLAKKKAVKAAKKAAEKVVDDCSGPGDGCSYERVEQDGDVVDKSQTATCQATCLLPTCEEMSSKVRQRAFTEGCAGDFYEDEIPEGMRCRSVSHSRTTSVASTRIPSPKETCQATASLSTCKGMSPNVRLRAFTEGAKCDFYEDEIPEGKLCRSYSHSWTMSVASTRTPSPKMLSVGNSMTASPMSSAGYSMMASPSSSFGNSMTASPMSYVGYSMMASASTVKWGFATA